MSSFLGREGRGQHDSISLSNLSSNCHYMPLASNCTYINVLTSLGMQFFNEDHGPTVELFMLLFYFLATLTPCLFLRGSLDDSHMMPLALGCCLLGVGGLSVPAPGGDVPAQRGSGGHQRHHHYPHNHHHPQQLRVVKCHAYRGFISVKSLAGWGNKFERSRNFTRSRNFWGRYLQFMKESEYKLGFMILIAIVNRLSKISSLI